MNTGMIERIPAETMARVYQEELPKIRAAMLAIGESCEKLRAAFQPEYTMDFRAELEYATQRSAPCSEDGFKTVADAFKRNAWGLLIQKLGIRKLMSNKRAAELDEAIHGQRRYNYGRDASTGQELPEITVDTLYDVLSGMVESADEFMCEAVAEEYDYWKPGRWEKYKTTSGPYKLGEKVIKGYMVEWKQWGKGEWDCNYNNRQHLSALDNIFHRLDGAGLPQGYGGPLVDAIKTAGDDGKGETDYFRFRCFKNGNLHLWFKRRDLLDKFNQIAGRNRLPGQDAA